MTSSGSERSSERTRLQLEQVLEQWRMDRSGQMRGMALRAGMPNLRDTLAYDVMSIASLEWPSYCKAKGLAIDNREVLARWCTTVAWRFLLRQAAAERRSATMRRKQGRDSAAGRARRGSDGNPLENAIRLEDRERTSDWQASLEHPDRELTDAVAKGVSIRSAAKQLELSKSAASRRWTKVRKAGASALGP
jgi:hypothetical protein